MSFSTLMFLFFLLFIIGIFLKSPFFKGIIGEKSLLLFLKTKLDNENYIILEDITLKQNSDTTQIDILVLSVYGIFVIEVKNYKGWIFGSENQKQWTQSIYKKKHKFQNPIHQNYKHIKFLERLLNTSNKNYFLKNVVVFVGESEFKTKLPEYVCRPKNLIDYIGSFNTQLITNKQLDIFIKTIERDRLEKGFNTNREHVNNLKNKF